MRIKLIAAGIAAILTSCLLSQRASADEIINSGSCNIVIQGSGNSISTQGACNNIVRKVINNNADDGYADVCLVNSSGATVCSMLLDGKRLSFSDGASFEVHGRYTGQVGLDQSAPEGFGRLFIYHVPEAEGMPDNLSLVSGFDLGFFNSATLKGNWENGHFTGQGLVTMANGGTMRGKFVNCVLIDGTATGIVNYGVGLMHRLWGKYTGSIKDGQIAIGELTSEQEIPMRSGRSLTMSIVDNGSFYEGNLLTGTHKLYSGGLWFSTIDYQEGRPVRAQCAPGQTGVPGCPN